MLHHNLERAYKGHEAVSFHDIGKEQLSHGTKMRSESQHVMRPMAVQ